MSLHLELSELLAAEFGAHLKAAPELRQDALILQLDNGVRLEVRYAAHDAYTLGWQWGDAALAIDTAPTHPGLATQPNHLHTADGRVLPDPLTLCGADPVRNLRVLVTALLEDPLLGTD
jgi:hypothetical protein